MPNLEVETAQSPTRRFGDRFATIVPNDDGDCFAKTARNDTGLNGYDPKFPVGKEFCRQPSIFTQAAERGNEEQVNEEPTGA